VVNSAKNYLTSQGRKPPASDVDASEADYYDGSDALKENNSPERSLLSDELQEKLFSTIDGLPDDLKAAITLREIEGLSYEEIATVMECPVGTVRSRIFRAREAIDKVILPLVQT
jgi:RNA polymerase sigma-70 factor (ECF subfamily)